MMDIINCKWYFDYIVHKHISHVNTNNVESSFLINFGDNFYLFKYLARYKVPSKTLNHEY